MNRETFFMELADFFNPDELKYIQRAYWLVKGAHAHQTRRLTGERYFEHVRRVAYFPIELGYRDPEIVALGLLHDVVEDTWVPQEVIVSLFGAAMYQDIVDLSKELPWFHPVTGYVIGRWKVPHVLYMDGLAGGSARVRLIKSSDRYDNLADLAQWEPARRAKYISETHELLPIVRGIDLRIAVMIEDRLSLPKEGNQ